MIGDELTPCANRDKAGISTGEGMAKLLGIDRSPKFTLNSRHQTDSHLMSRRVLPSGKRKTIF